MRDSGLVEKVRVHSLNSCVDYLTNEDVMGKLVHVSAEPLSRDGAIDLRLCTTLVHLSNF